MRSSGTKRRHQPSQRARDAAADLPTPAPTTKKRRITILPPAPTSLPPENPSQPSSLPLCTPQQQPGFLSSPPASLGLVSPIPLPPSQYEPSPPPAESPLFVSDDIEVPESEQPEQQEQEQMRRDNDRKIGGRKPKSCGGFEKSGQRARLYRWRLRREHT